MEPSKPDPVFSDPLFSDPRLAPLYDVLDSDRSDLDAYVELIAGLGATSVLDVGCGTGTLACRLAAMGYQVVGVDPAEASLEVAKAKPRAERVRWVSGDATALDALGNIDADVATMTANVAQVFLTDEAWTATLTAIGRALRPGGHLIFESRDPDRQAWLEWTPERTRSITDVAGIGPVETWLEPTELAPPLISFRRWYRFDDGAIVASDSTLRFRSSDELTASVRSAGFEVMEVRDAPDRPGKEFVFVCLLGSSSAGPDRPTNRN